MRFSIGLILYMLLLTCKCEIDTNDLDLHDVSNLLSDLDISADDVKNHKDYNRNKQFGNKFSKSRSKDQKYFRDDDFKLQRNYHYKKNERKLRKEFRNDKYRSDRMKTLLDHGISSTGKYAQINNYKPTRSYDLLPRRLKEKRREIYRSSENFDYTDKNVYQDYFDEKNMIQIQKQPKHYKKSNNKREIRQPTLEQQKALLQHQEFETRLIFDHQRLLENQRLFEQQHQQALQQERAIENQRLLRQNQQQALQQQAQDMQRALELQNQRLIQQHNQGQQRMLQEQRALALQQEAVRQQRLQQQQAIVLHQQQAIQQQRILLQKRRQFFQEQARKQKTAQYLNY